MTDVRMRMLRPGDTGPTRASGMTAWVPTRAFDAPTGLVLPAPLQVVHTTTADVTLTGVSPTDGVEGWCWIATTWVDGVVVEQRAVLVPPTGTVDFEDLPVVDPRSLVPADSALEAWRVLYDRIVAEIAALPNGVRKINTTTMTFTRNGVDVLGPLTLPAGPQGNASTVPGPAGTITGVTAVALAAGAAPTVTMGGTASARTFQLGIPAGAKGDAGEILSVTVSALAPGATPTIALGGTPSARTIALGLPRGEKGDPGELSGTVTIGQLPTGTTSTTVALGNHVHAASGITSGTFAPARLPAATLTAIGAAELATATETLIGTDTDRIVTPAGLRSVLRNTAPTNAVFIGTSNVVQANESGEATFTTKLCAKFGWTQRNYAVGGMGYTIGNTSTERFSAQLTRAVNDAAFANADVGYVFICDAANDARSYADVETPANALIASAVSNFPNARVIVLPAIWSNNSVDAASDGPGASKRKYLMRVVNQLKKAAARNGAEFVDGSWTWFMDEPSTLVKPDEVHMTAAGYDRIVEWMSMFLRGGDTWNNRGWNDQTPVSGNGWAMPTNGDPWLSAMRDGDQTFLQGMLKPPAGGWAFGAVPVVLETGFRPSVNQTVWLAQGGSTTPIYANIGPNGNLTFQVPSTRSDNVTIVGSFPNY